MTLIELLNITGLEHLRRDAVDLLGQLPPDTPEDWRNLAVVLALRIASRRANGSAMSDTLGIGGGQGAGKTTLSGLLAGAIGGLGLEVAVLSLDDFYLTRAERNRLALDVHPLLATRGVPGTHDVGLAVEVLGALKSGAESISPGFDKAVDDRAAGQTRLGPALDVVIFEGWCVGVPPQSLDALEAPCNDLERLEDPDGRWRRFVNDRLTRDYPALWGLLDELLYLHVPDIEAVIRWRTEQERDHSRSKRMSTEALARFVAHYERLTLWMGAVLPQTAEMVGFLDENHRLTELILHPPSAQA